MYYFILSIMCRSKKIFLFLKMKSSLVYTEYFTFKIQKGFVSIIGKIFFVQSHRLLMQPQLVQRNECLLCWRNYAISICNDLIRDSRSSNRESTKQEIHLYGSIVFRMPRMLFCIGSIKPNHQHKAYPKNWAINIWKQRTVHKQTADYADWSSQYTMRHCL